MYSPTTRLLTILELLQSYKRMSGSEIARRLGVNKRTVRRYIVMLQDMGIPIETERGPYGSYQLERGFKMPPLMFTDAEAIALTLGLLAIRELQFPVDVASVEGALAKTERVMPERLFNQARGLQEAISFYVRQPPRLLQNDFIARLSLAVRQGQQVQLRYRAWNGDESERIFDPYGIVFNDGYWYTAGYCHLRHDLRTFRLDRVTELEISDGSFERPTDFDMMGHVLHSITSFSGADQLEIFLETTMECAQEIFPPILGKREATAEGVIFRRSASQLEWVAYVLLSVDFPVRIIETQALRDLLGRISTRAAQLAGST